MVESSSRDAARSGSPSVPPSRPFCADISRDSGEGLAATASRVDHWLLVEYRGLWSHDAIAGSGLADQVKDSLGAQLAALPHSKLLFIRRRERRRAHGIAVFYARSAIGGVELRGLELGGYDELAQLDLASIDAAPRRDPLLLVCTHGKHDRCCARYGRPVHDALAEQAEPDWVWQSTHVGGDRFAANVVVLPEGLYYGRVTVHEAWPLLDEHLNRRLYLARFRGRSSFPMAVQAAEIEIRRVTGLPGIDDLELEEIERRGEAWAIRFSTVRGESYEVEVVREAGPLTYLTCSAVVLRHPRRFVAFV